MQYAKVETLKPHPLNNDYFKDLEGDDWQRLLEDIAENGIRDPLRVTMDGCVICGHQRLRAAKELGIDRVPVIYEDLSEDEAEKLLIQDNLNRRHLDTLQKAKLAAKLRERWGVKNGINQHSRVGQNVQPKTTVDIAHAIGEDYKTTQRLIKIANDLIPEFQDMISSGKLGIVKAESLAHLTPEEQRALYDACGESVGERTLEEVKQLRRLIEEERKTRQALEQQLREMPSEEEVTARIERALEREREQYEVKLQQAEAKLKEVIETNSRTIERLQRELEEAQNTTKKVEVVPEEIKAAIRQLQEQNDQLLAQLEAKDEAMKKLREDRLKAIKEKERLEEAARQAEMERKWLEETIRSASVESEQVKLVQTVTQKMFEYRKEIEGLLQVIDPKKLTESCFTSLVTLAADVRQLYVRLDQLAEHMQGTQNVVFFRKGER